MPRWNLWWIGCPDPDCAIYWLRLTASEKEVTPPIAHEHEKGRGIDTIYD